MTQLRNTRVTRVQFGRGCLPIAKVPPREDLKKICVLFLLGVAMASGWNYEQWMALISIWGQEDVQRELDGVTRSRTVYERITSELRKLG